MSKKYVFVKLRLDCEAQVSVPAHLSDEDAMHLATEIAITRSEVVLDKEQSHSTEKDGLNEYLSAASEEAKATALKDWLQCKAIDASVSCRSEEVHMLDRPLVEE